MMATWQFADVGNIALILGLVIAIYVLAAALYGVKARRPEFLASARNGIYVTAGLATLAIVILEWALVTNQFRFEYVASHVSSGQPLLYTLSALWGGQEGSLLFWAWLLAIFSAIAVLQNRNQNRELMPYVMVFLSMTQAFFFILILFTSSPFKLLAAEPAEGNGLNPLLQNPGMFIHPITQYIGFVGFTIPWAFAMAALVTGRLGEMWIHTTRRWALFSWLFLSLGLLFGMRWAYVELGWGGYWGWDPVENAALVPWLTGTAYLHSVMIQEKRGMLKVWNLGLVFATFWLSIWGTFDTRSGLAQSVHAFGVSTLGPYFLGFIFLTLIVFLYFVVTRLDRLKDENELDSVLSREATFLFNNLILVGAAFIVWWGSHFSTISEVFTGRQISVAAPFFNQMVGPILLALLVLVGICTLIGWRRASADNFIRNFTRPLIAAFVALVVLFIVGIRDPLGLLAFTSATFVLSTIVFEFYRGTVARRRQYAEAPPVATVRLVTKNRRRYGGYIVHLGVVLIAFGIAGSNLYQVTDQQNLKPGETMQIGSYTLRFDGLKMTPSDNRQDIQARISLMQSGQAVAALTPTKAYYPAADQMTTEVSVRSTAQEDLYLILAGWTDDGSATIKAIINPLVSWLWLGFVVFIAGTLVAMYPDPREARQLARLQSREALAGVQAE